MSPPLLKTYRPLQQIACDPVNLLDELRLRRKPRPALQRLTN